jgi:hypothetical protein
MITCGKKISGTFFGGSFFLVGFFETEKLRFPEVEKIFVNSGSYLRTTAHGTVCRGHAQNSWIICAPLKKKIAETKITIDSEIIRPVIYFICQQLLRDQSEPFKNFSEKLFEAEEENLLVVLNLRTSGAIGHSNTRGSQIEMDPFSGIDLPLTAHLDELTRVCFCGVLEFLKVGVGYLQAKPISPAKIVTAEVYFFDVCRSQNQLRAPVVNIGIHCDA